MTHPGTDTRSLSDLTTPCLLLDLQRMRKNIDRLASHMASLSGTLRPHVKTNKCIQVTQEIIAAGQVNGITVSTLQEAEYFFAHGCSDILYAVGIVPAKLPAVADLTRRGCHLKIVLDSVEIAEAVVADAEKRQVTHRVMIELDSDGHRSGVRFDDDRLLDIARIIADSPDCELVGVMTHAGESYHCRDAQSLLALARQERDTSIAAAERIRAAGIACPVVSIGSTPTALAIDHLNGVTEVRAGVYVFFDLVMAGIGVCDTSEIALSVLVSVSGHQKERNLTITDGGWMALSRDRGTRGQAVDYGYGAVLDSESRPVEDLVVSGASQEHGMISRRASVSPLPYEQLPLGGLLRILPNHACATAAQFDEFVVVDDNNRVIDRWSRTRGW
ncbi:alanine racemase [Chromatocurvus halotolerans]|uniref:D-serine deaminase-like pyridoxal phosphate-dependent protein n=1 Tax=Chromatocurvus halotolerans TaxID=1132028 RepID=A0A4R2L3J2_9GAMM|nr:alanine racemase [Chromatocurvus halotolerans]TCO78376.1 D-serine deaminase-like pyridoxal phosphate-dependent protein [Chromatocurvus halotolerans]